MNLIDNVEAALRTWTEHRSELAQLTATRPDDWRKRTVDYRRVLQADTARLTAAVEALDGDETVRAEGRELRAALSLLRACVVEHQTKWPVVSIDPADPAYRQSGAKLNAAIDCFTATSAQILARVARR